MYGAVPPDGVKSMLPVLAPKHNTSFGRAFKLRAFGAVTVALVVVLQLFASVTVTVYVPAIKLLMSCDAALLLHAYVYGAAPPLTVKSIDPFPPPLQLTFIWVEFKLKT